MSEFATVIRYQFEGEPASSIVLDTINSTVVNSPTTITTQPVVSGDEISDHQFNEPKTLTVSGSCSLNGSKVLVIDGSGSKLANFEELLERIQNEAVLCDVYKISLQNEKDIRFKQRTNMALESLSYTEHINSLDFTLNFRQVLIADVVEYDVDLDDANLPNVTQPSTTSFTNNLIDWSKVDATVIKTLEKESLMSTTFKTFLSSLDGQSLAVYVGAVAFGVLITAIAVSASVPVVGWVIAGIAAIGAGVLFLAKAISNAITKASNRRKYAIEQFQYHNNSAKDKKELERFSDFIYSIHKEVESLNDILHVYQISTNEPQEAMVNIGDDYHIFTFTRNNVDNTYSLHTENVDKTITSSMTNISSALQSIDELTSSNYLFKASNNARVYLMNASEDKSVLTNYCIVVCDFNPDDFNSMIEQIIANKIYRNAGG